MTRQELELWVTVFATSVPYEQQPARLAEMPEEFKLQLAMLAVELHQARDEQGRTR